jgi:ribonuclease BN (tRNA processing enzyme)
MQIRILGCSGGIGPGLRTTSLLIDGTLLVDAGTGVGDLDMAELAAIRDVVLTHSHLDHVCGLAFMADNLFGVIDRPLNVHASQATLTTLREHVFNWKLWPDFTALPNAETPLLVFHTLEPTVRIDIGRVGITPFKVLHTVPSVGYVLECADSVFAFSGDTYATDRLWDFLNTLPKLDQLMIEIAFSNRDAELGKLARHFTPSLLGEELRKLRHRPRLLLSHAKPGSEQAIVDECVEALAGWEYRHLRNGERFET